MPYSCLWPVTKKKPVENKESFRQALEIHLNAIKNGNIDELRPTVAYDVSMISPDGNKIDSKEVFMKFHKNWFKQTNWEWEGNILVTESSDSLGYGLIQYTFIQKDSVGNVLFEDHEYLVLIFRNTAQGWQLVHDQNTRIQKN